MASKHNRAVKCLATGPNAPFLNGVKMQDQTCETEAEAEALVASGLFAYTSDAKKADIERAAKEEKARINQKAADEAGGEAVSAREGADAAVEAADEAEDAAKAKAAIAKRGG